MLLLIFHFSVFYFVVRVRDFLNPVQLFKWNDEQWEWKKNFCSSQRKSLRFVYSLQYNMNRKWKMVETIAGFSISQFPLSTGKNYYCSHLYMSMRSRFWCFFLYVSCFCSVLGNRNEEKNRCHNKSLDLDSVFHCQTKTMYYFELFAVKK